MSECKTANVDESQRYFQPNFAVNGYGNLNSLRLLSFFDEYPELFGLAKFFILIDW
ncbi:MAG: hypothetical protein AAF226_11550 [Verrucomicrobiota bacterium]